MKNLNNTMCTHNLIGVMGCAHYYKEKVSIGGSRSKSQK